MKRSSAIPRQRQSPLAILVLISKILQNLIKQMGALIIVFLLGGKMSEKIGTIAMFAGAFLLFSLAKALVSYFRFYYQVKDGELIVEKGLFEKTKTTIPIERIQAVDFDQSPIHKILNLVKVVINTAGSSGDEANIAALTLDKAEELRAAVLSRKSVGFEGMETTYIAAVEDNRIMQLSITELLKVGLSANHFRSATIILGFGFWIFQQAEDAGLWDRLQALLPDKDVITGSITILIALMVIMSIAALVISIVTTFVTYFNLKLVRIDDSFRLSYGLLNSRQFTAKDKKIQLLTVAQTWLQRRFDYYTVYLKQAASQALSNKKSLSIPGARQVHIDNIQQYLFGRIEDGDNWEGISPYYRRYHMRNVIVITSLLIGVAVFLENWKVVIALVIVLIYALVHINKSYHKLMYNVSEVLVQIKGGAFGGKLGILETHKVQSVSVNASLYQRRRDLASIRIHTASGSVNIPFLTEQTAIALRDYLLYNVETSKKAWM